MQVGAAAVAVLAAIGFSTQQVGSNKGPGTEEETTKLHPEQYASAVVAAGKTLDMNYNVPARTAGEGASRDDSIHRSVRIRNLGTVLVLQARSAGAGHLPLLTKGGKFLDTDSPQAYRRAKDVGYQPLELAARNDPGQTARYEMNMPGGEAEVITVRTDEQTLAAAISIGDPIVVVAAP
jgi:hypothetical protein